MASASLAGVVLGQSMGDFPMEIVMRGFKRQGFGEPRLCFALAVVGLMVISIIQVSRMLFRGGTMESYLLAMVPGLIAVVLWRLWRRRRRGRG